LLEVLVLGLVALVDFVEALEDAAPEGMRPAVELDLMIEARRLLKRFGPTVALDGLDLEGPAGAILPPRRPPPARLSHTTPGVATTIVRALGEADVSIDDVQVHQPLLDGVFFALTGQAARKPALPEAA